VVPLVVKEKVVSLRYCRWVTRGMNRWHLGR